MHRKEVIYNKIYYNMEIYITTNSIWWICCCRRRRRRWWLWWSEASESATAAKHLHARWSRCFVFTFCCFFAANARPDAIATATHHTSHSYVSECVWPTGRSTRNRGAHSLSFVDDASTCYYPLWKRHCQPIFLCFCFGLSAHAVCCFIFALP